MNDKQQKKNDRKNIEKFEKRKILNILRPMEWK